MLVFILAHVLLLRLIFIFFFSTCSLSLSLFQYLYLTLYCSTFNHFFCVYSNSLKLFTFLLPLYRYGFDSSPSFAQCTVVGRSFTGVNVSIAPFFLYYTIHANFNSAFRLSVNCELSLSISIFLSYICMCVCCQFLVFFHVFLYCITEQEWIYNIWNTCSWEVFQ